MIRQGLLSGIDHKTACKNYLKAAVKGVVKVISKMGISTIQSYWGAQIFEAIGLKQSFVDKYFTWTPTRVEGVDIDVIGGKSSSGTSRHFPRAGPVRGCSIPAANTNGGRTASLTCSIRRRFTNCSPPSALGVTRSSKSISASRQRPEPDLCTLRGMLEFKHAKPVPIEEVESVESILSASNPAP